MLVIIVLGGGFGAARAFIFALDRARLTWSVLLQVLVESARTTVRLFTLPIAATIFVNLINFTAMPGDLTNLITKQGLSSTMVVVAMMAICLVLGTALGTAMEELTMVLLTIPLFFPIVTALGFDPI